MNLSSTVPGPPEWRDQFVTFVGSPALYRRLDTRITTEFFESAGRRYPVAELGLVRRAVVAAWPRPRRFELWAQFQGRTVRLFQCRNEREFGQVCRALLRAQERAWEATEAA